MTVARIWLVFVLVVSLAACNGNGESPDASGPDTPLGPACSDGIDNDGDGLVDYPNDPGCQVPLVDSESDDCPNGPLCPQCADGK